MSVAVITSCSKEGWEKYGQRFVETFAVHWPLNVDLHVVSEDLLDIPRFVGRSVHFWTLWDSKDACTFRDRFGPDKRAQGLVTERRIAKGTKYKHRIAAGYDFRLDAVKFSKKVFAIELIASKLSTDKLFWVDADIVTFATVPNELFERVLPQGYDISCLQRPGYHSECGFVGYALGPTARAFIADFAKLYTSGDVFNLEEWHDSWVFDWLRGQSPVATYAIPHRDRRHPFINSELGLYMDHMKGRRKDFGRSPSWEQKTHQKVPYWWEE